MPRPKKSSRPVELKALPPVRERIREKPDESLLVTNKGAIKPKAMAAPVRNGTKKAEKRHERRLDPLPTTRREVYDLRKKLEDKVKVTVDGRRYKHGSIDLAFALLPYGKAEGMDFAALAARHCETVKRVVELWNRIGRYARKRMTIDDLCERVGVEPMREFLGPVVGEMGYYCQHVSELVAAVEHLPILKATIKYAKERGGFKDRELLLQHSGFAPAPKGNSVNVFAQAVGVVHKDSEDAESLPDFEADTKAATSVLRS